MKKIVNFIKYNNAFVIIMGFIFAAVSGAMASETARDAIIGKTIVTREGVDNSLIVNANLSNLNIYFKIADIKEDRDGYNVEYHYNTIYIKDGVWQPILKEDGMYVSKKVLGGKDLGLYIFEELSQKADREVAYLKEVQILERKNGLKTRIESVEYTGLKGIVLEGGKKTVEGYNPIKEEKSKKEMAGNYNPASVVLTEGESGFNDTQKEDFIRTQVIRESLDKNVVREMVQQIIDEKIARNSSPSSSSQSSQNGAESSSSVPSVLQENSNSALSSSSNSSESISNSASSNSSSMSLTDNSSSSQSSESSSISSASLQSSSSLSYSSAFSATSSESYSTSTSSSHSSEAPISSSSESSLSFSSSVSSVAEENRTHLKNNE